MSSPDYAAHFTNNTEYTSDSTLVGVCKPKDAMSKVIAHSTRSMGGRKSVFRRDPQKSMVIAFREDLQQSGMCRFRYRSGGLKTLKSLKQHAVQKLRETVVPSCVTLEEITEQMKLWSVQSTARTLGSCV